MSVPVATMPIDPVFDFVQGYPKDWEARRQYIHLRDRSCCQVTGCLNTTYLDVHHIVPISTNPDHRTDNLILLCRFHHAMLPDHGKLGRGDDSRYHLVPAHWRRLPSRTKRVPIKAHVQHLQGGRITKEGMVRLITELDQRYVIDCMHCNGRDWDVKLRTDINRVMVRCTGCKQVWLYERSLREEIGVQLFGTALRATQRHGLFQFSTEKLSVRPPIEPYVCDDCHLLGYLSIFSKKYNKQNGTVFLGCERWSRCHRTQIWRHGDEIRMW